MMSSSVCVYAHTFFFSREICWPALWILQFLHIPHQLYKYALKVWFVYLRGSVLFHQVKPTDRPGSMSCVALLSPTEKSVSLQSATLCQCSQARSRLTADFWLKYLKDLHPLWSVCSWSCLAACQQRCNQHRWYSFQIHNKGAYLRFMAKVARRFFTAFDFLLSCQKAQM